MGCAQIRSVNFVLAEAASEQDFIASLASDVLIIGGGPAGLTAAIAARMRGLSVTVADGARPPIDKGCGEGILPPGVENLAQLGVRVPHESSFRFRGVRFVDGLVSVEARFASSVSGLGIRRTLLHQMLIDRASELGVQLRWGTPIADASPLHSENGLLARMD